MICVKFLFLTTIGTFLTHFSGVDGLMCLVCKPKIIPLGQSVSNKVALNWTTHVSRTPFVGDDERTESSFGFCDDLNTKYPEQKFQVICPKKAGHRESCVNVTRVAGEPAPRNEETEPDWVARSCGVWPINEDEPKCDGGSDDVTVCHCFIDNCNSGTWFEASQFLTLVPLTFLSQYYWV